MRISAIACWAAALMTAQVSAESLTRFTLLHINDTHSHIEAAPARVKLAGQELYTEIGGMARLETVIQQLKQQQQAQNLPTLLLHGGDAFKGTGYFEVHQSKVNSDLFNRLGVQAMALGNHEFDAGLAELATFSKDAQFPLLAANVETELEPSLQGALQPMALFELTNGQLTRTTQPQKPAATVAVIGLALEDMPQIAPNTGKLQFLSEVATAQQLIDQLEQQGINKIILLTHLGFERDLAIARQLDGVDVVVGGHSHSYLADLEAWGKGKDERYASRVANKNRDSSACVVTAGQYTHLLGAVDLSFDAAGNLQHCEGAATLLSSPMLFHKASRDLTDLNTQPSLQQAFQALPNTRLAVESSWLRAHIEQTYKPAVIAKYGQRLTTLLAPLPHVRLPGAEGSDQHGSKLAPVIAQAMLDYVNSSNSQQQLHGTVDLALVAAGGIRAPLEAGDVFEGNILMEVLPYETALTVLTVTGQTLRELLHTSIVPTLPKGAHAGKYPYTAGLRYVARETTTGSLEFAQLEVYQQGQWQVLSDKQQYRMVTTNYLANGNDGWFPLAQAQLQQTDRVDLALNHGVLTAYPVKNLSAQQQGQVTKYSPSYQGPVLDCQNKAEGLYCGTQNQAVLQYFKQATLPTLPVFVTLQRMQE